MEVVRVFNNELSSLYEVKPPISKAKMTQITKNAIKGIKFYKHIVQSVEKFIQKCRPEYKVPGLYVVDSIVRQSRHQFGAEKDVFGPRFVKNISLTFQHLFKCPEDERPKIIRVLNLWQKNAVFPIEVIQPLLDMGHPNSSSDWPSDAPADTSKESPAPAPKIKEDPRHKSSSHPPSSSPWKGWPQGNEEPVHDSKPYAEMSTKNLEKFNKAEMSNAAKEDDASHASMFKNQVKLEKVPEETVKFNKKLLDFDYGDEEDEEEPKNDDSNLPTTPNALALSMAQNFLSNPELLRQLHQMTAVTIPPSDIPISSLPTKVDEPEATYSQDMQSSPHLSLIPPPSYQQPVMSHNLHLSKGENDTDDRILPEQPVPSRDLDERSLASVMASHDRLLPPMCLPALGVCQPPLPDKDDRFIPDPPLPSRDFDERSLASIVAPSDRAVMPPLPYGDNSNLMHFQYDKNGIPFQPPLPMMEPLNMDQSYPGIMPPDPHMMQNNQGDEDERVMYSMPGEPPLPPQDFDERHIMMPVEERNRKERSRSRSRSRGRSGRHRSRSRSPRRKRSRSRSRTRKNRSRSRDRERERERIREKERERDRERDRRRKGIPPIKKGCVSVCSTTLWLGHVPKSCSEVDISDNFGQYGTILSIDMIPPRGCAYVVMDRRQDANRALQKLKNVKLQGSSIKMAWAPGKGVKGKEFKEYWEVELGVSYVPFEKIKEDPENLDLLEEGGFIDEDSLPDHLKALRQQPDGEKNTYNMNNNTLPDAGVAYNEMPAVPNMVPPPIMPPTSVGLPMVLPHLMQPQFGLLPGMLPPQAMVMQVPMGIPPPTPMLMVQQQSQSLLGSQAMSMVGGVPPIVPRTLPPVSSSLPNLKSSIHGEPALPSSTATVASTAAAGDATPTEEEGTSVSSPSVQKSVSSIVSAPTLSVSSAQPVTSMAQFNHMLGLSANRPIISVPPPVSTAGTPIPYPPPNVSFNFPPPGMRPHGQAHGLPPNIQFPWMQKQLGSPFTEADSTQSANSAPIRPVPPPQGGLPPHMLLNRPPFHEAQSSASNLKSPVKETKGKDKCSETETDRNSSGQHDRSQEMVISTDDESSMDIEYPRNDMPHGFPPDFSRAPMNMPRMRGPSGPMQHNPRFPRGMGSPYPMRMGGPRGMGAPNMHGRMDMDFSPHGPRGPRMSMGPHGPRRNDMHDMHHPHDGRDWYPRDFEGPPFERERDRRFRDDWGREGREQWGGPDEMEHDTRRNSRDSRDLDDHRRDERRDSWNRDRPDNLRSRDNLVNEPVEKPKSRSSNKNRSSAKDLMDDLVKYTKGAVSIPKANRNDHSKDKPAHKESYTGEKKQNINSEQVSKEKELGTEQNSVTRKDRDREARKRSRWGRTLSEEREFQEQRRNELEMKFQCYEKDHAAQLAVQGTSENSVLNPDEVSATNIDPTQTAPISNTELTSVNEPNQSEINFAVQNEINTDVPANIPVEMLEQNISDRITETDNVLVTEKRNCVLSIEKENVMIPNESVNVTLPAERENLLAAEKENMFPTEKENIILPIEKEYVMLPIEREDAMLLTEKQNTSTICSEIGVESKDDFSMGITNDTPSEQTFCTEYNAPINSDAGDVLKDSDALNSSKVIDAVHFDSDVIESKVVSCIPENDLRVDNGVTNSTPCESEKSDNVGTNNSPLLTTES